MLRYSRLEEPPIETIHAICSPCYGKMPNLREPIPLVMPHCYGAVCCYCRQAKAYEGIFYKDEPRRGCQCTGIAQGLAEMNVQHSALRKAGHPRRIDEHFILLDDGRGRGAHLHPVVELDEKARAKWLELNAAQGRHLYTGYPQQEK